MQGLQADPQHLGGPGLVAAGGIERRHDQLLLRLVHGHPGRDGHGVGRARRGGGGAQRRQVRRFNHLAAGQDRGPLDHVAELADVAGPVVAFEQPHGGRRHGLHSAVIARVELVDERLDQERQVVLALAERRQREAEHVEPVVQVLAQPSLADGHHRIDVGGGNHPHVHFLLGAAAQAAELPLLQHPQQLHLRRRRHLRNLVEEQRAAVGQLEAAQPPFGRAGERAPLVAEDLALEQGVGNRRAVEGDERRGSARAQLVNGLRHQFLAGAGFAQQQHRGRRRRRLFQHVIEGAHRGAVPDDAAEPPALVQLAPQRLVLALLPVDLRQPLEQPLQLMRIERLGQVVFGAGLDGLHGGVHGALGRQQDYLDVLDVALERVEQVEPAHSRHHQVRDDDRGPEVGHPLQRLGAVARGLGGEPPRPHQFGQPAPRGRVIVHDENTFGGM